MLNFIFEQNTERRALSKAFINMIATFPHLGNTYITAKVLLDEVGVKYIVPPFDVKEALEIGTKVSPEGACLPLKVNLGNYIKAYEKGADTIIITGGKGPCRFGYYSEMEKEILKSLGIKMDVIALEVPDNGLIGFAERIKKISGSLNIYKIYRAVKEAARTSVEVDELERLTFQIRPRELNKGETDRIYTEFRAEILNCYGAKQIHNKICETKERLNKIAIDENICPLKVGIVGEIYTTIDSATSMNLDIKLGSMGVEVSRAVTVSGWVLDHMLKPILKLPCDTTYITNSKPYLGAMIGGHARETVGNSVSYAKENYDGILQLYPLTCMPEIVAQSILPAVSRDFNIPILTLVIDEMSGEEGYITRLEAFTDLLLRRRERGQIAL